MHMSEKQTRFSRSARLGLAPSLQRRGDWSIGDPR